MKKVTLKDIAKETGLSVVTVSKVLNSKDDTAACKEKIELINQTASKLGYSIRSKPMSTPKAKPIKIGVFTIANHQMLYKHPFYRGLFSAIKEYALKVNVQIQYFHDLEEIRTNTSLKSMVFDSEVKSIIILGEIYGTENSEVQALKNRFNHVVSISTYFYSDQLVLDNDVIIIDTYYSSKNVLNNLIQNGRKNILLLSGPMANNMMRPDYQVWRKVADGRELAYYEVLTENGVPLNKNLIHNCDWNPDIAYDILEDLLINKKIEIDAIFAGDDMIAIACMKLLNKYKISIPETVAVIGFNNQEFSRYTSPSLSTIDVYCDTIGSMAVELIKYKNNSGDEVPLKIIVPSNYIKRKSCGL